MPHQLMNSDTSLIIGTDGIKHIKKEVPASYFEAENSSNSTSGDFSAGGILRWEWWNSVANAVSVENIIHMDIKNNGADPVKIGGIASLISKMEVYINNIRVMVIQNEDNSQFLEQLKEIKNAENDFDLQRIKSSKQGRIAASSDFHPAHPNGATRTYKLDLNKVLNDLFIGLDNSKAAKCAVEITWRTSTGAQEISKFLQNTANNTDMYTGGLAYTNSFIRCKYIILESKYINTKAPITKQLLQVEKQTLSMTSATEKIIKLDDVFSAKKRASALMIVVRETVAAYNSADCFKTGASFQINYKVFIGGKEVKKRDKVGDALEASLKWVHSEGGAMVDIEDSVFNNYYPWYSATIPLNNIYQPSTGDEKLSGISNSPQSNYEIHLTITSGSMFGTVELYLLYSEMLKLDGKAVKVFT